MSYDLWFRLRDAGATLDESTIREFFLSRNWYTEQSDQFWYENEDTGVYFSFDLSFSESDPNDHEGAEADPLAVPLAFNINYCRPHFFGLEAERELAALINRFSLLVDDPQVEGMGSAEYSRDGFLRGWNAGNVVGHEAYLTRTPQQQTADPATNSLPAETLERIWGWNYEKARLQEGLGETIYVPGIRLVRLDGRPQSFVVWGDAIPEAVPKVDFIVMVREELAPRKLWRKKKDTCLVPYSVLGPVLRLGREVESPTPYTLFAAQDPPSDLVEFFQSQTPFSGQLDSIAYDSILTKEVVDQASGRAAGT